MNKESFIIISIDLAHHRHRDEAFKKATLHHCDQCVPVPIPSRAEFTPSVFDRLKLLTNKKTQSRVNRNLRCPSHRKIDRVQVHSPTQSLPEKLRKTPFSNIPGPDRIVPRHARPNQTRQPFCCKQTRERRGIKYGYE